MTQPKMAKGSGGDMIPISLVAHLVFCPRRAWLEAAGEVTDTWQVAEGSASHAATDDPASARPAALRAIDVADVSLGVTGRCDTIEVAPDGGLTVVEYKATPVRREPRITDAMRIQLALQVGALRAAGHLVTGQAVYFTNHRVRVPVALEEDDFAAARAAALATRATVEAPEAPPPLEDDARCMSCSHAGICLPEERAEEVVTRRIVVADPDTQVVHLATAGSRASTRNGRMLVHAHGDEIASIPARADPGSRRARERRPERRPDPRAALALSLDRLVHWIRSRGRMGCARGGPERR